MMRITSSTVAFPSLMANVCRHEGAGGDRRKDPHRNDYNGSNDGGRGSDFFVPARLGGIGERTTFAEHVRRGDSLKQLCSHEHNQHVVQTSDHRNEVRDELNGTQQIACGACCYQPCVPAGAGMFQDKIADMRFFLESLHPPLPAHRKCRFRSHHVGSQTQISASCSNQFAVHRNLYGLRYEPVHRATTGKSDSREEAFI